MDVVANANALYTEFRAPLVGLASTGSHAQQPADLSPMPSSQEMLDHAVGLCFVGWVRTARVGPFGIRPVLVMYIGSFVSP